MTFTGADWLGFGALLVSLTGQFLVAHRNRHGWKLRFLAGFVWFSYATAIQRWPLVVTALTYLCIDLYGLLNARRK